MSEQDWEAGAHVDRAANAVDKVSWEVSKMPDIPVTCGVGLAGLHEAVSTVRERVAQGEGQASIKAVTDEIEARASGILEDARGRPRQRYHEDVSGPETSSHTWFGAGLVVGFLGAILLRDSE